MNKNFNLDEQRKVFGLLSEAYVILLGDTHRRMTLKEQDQVLEMVQNARMIMIGNKQEAV
jgi:uncharacterized protein with von Willebrand factor type A (vWA) domain